MDLERLDEIRELFAATLEGSGIRAEKKARAQQLFNRVADAHHDLVTVLEAQRNPQEATAPVTVEPEKPQPEIQPAQ